jgi:hypothetical protein
VGGSSFVERDRSIHQENRGSRFTIFSLGRASGLSNGGIGTYAKEPGETVADAVAAQNIKLRDRVGGISLPFEAANRGHLESGDHDWETLIRSQHYWER